MICGVGVDLVTISRVEGILKRFGTKFESRVYTTDERNQAGGRTAYLAGRFAVKEALLKALGTGLAGGVRWQDIETINLGSGAPDVRCYGKVMNILDSEKVSRIWASISHEKDHVVALVVLEGG